MSELPVSVLLAFAMFCLTLAALRTDDTGINALVKVFLEMTKRLFK